MRTIDRNLEPGDTLELGDDLTHLNARHPDGPRWRGTIRIVGAYDGEPQTFVCLRDYFSDGDDIDFPVSAEVLGVLGSGGEHSRANPSVIYVVPLEAYGGEA